MYEIGIIAILLLVLVLVIIGLIYTITLYYDYQNDKKDREEAYCMVKRIVFLILAREGLDCNQLEPPLPPVPPKQRKNMFSFWNCNNTPCA